MNIPKIYPITPSYLSTNQLLTSIKNLKRDGLNLFLYRRKELYKSVIEAELSLITKLCLFGKTPIEYSRDTVKMFYNDAAESGYKL